MPTQSTVALAGISKRYGPVQALRDVSLTVGTGEVLGLIGENGAGKSTLIGVLSGTVRPDTGTMTVGGREAPLGDPRALGGLGVAVVVQEQALVESLRVYENIYLGREIRTGGRGPGRKRRLRAAATALLRDMHVDDVRADALVADLTYPQRQLVEIAKAFADARTADTPPLILLDEPTSALSEHEAELLFSLIERWRDRASFIYVSHILPDVLRLSTRLLVLRDGQVVDDVHNEGVTDRRLHELMVGRERSADYYRETDQTGASATEPILEIRGGSVAGAFTDVDLAIRPGEIVGVAGVIGSGKSELAAAVAGARSLDGGSLTVDGRRRDRWSVRRAVRAGVCYVPPERANDSLFVTMSVRGNISIGFLDLLTSRWSGLLRLRDERGRAAGLASRLRIKTDSLATPIRELSGGNQQKAVFARWLARKVRVFVLDDPTRGIDVGTREEIYTMIRGLTRDGVGVLLCAESLEEIIGLADRIVVLKDGRVTAEIASPATSKPTDVDVISHMM
ncbi:sugar ABC transporter ATP-binding protein [Frankia sp. CNm7]|uniref:Sugar ABC transporter ATP-binding protein n=1 Tax=Frankia nepalensis TaxID=1836974 RepID=A0A937RPN2_9ACTN|nr:sugar ABC transporter ATP-binding protein [Frankia nepalensis]MBL7498828.1 sugar ABC transporter ATP-binding protein [Frankia nepalensis]MBL7508633.1 sugar ABC transporter ATP-binding protein [Frankia nepalensis]MBL7519270.1 sugar ABC transporter ATP-binding protein [Frankia nepalensis]MBL7629696.1 sugar ABC transporter ATP-binding protein [Frankia nepalensis]